MFKDTLNEPTPIGRQARGRRINSSSSAIGWTVRGESTALAAVFKALMNYTRVEDYDIVLVLWFRTWAKDNLDPTKYNLNGVPSSPKAGSLVP